MCVCVCVCVCVAFFVCVYVCVYFCVCGQGFFWSDLCVLVPRLDITSVTFIMFFHIPTSLTLAAPPNKGILKKQGARMCEERISLETHVKSVFGSNVIRSVNTLE